MKTDCDDDRIYYEEQLLDGCNNYWIAQAFLPHIRNVLSKLPLKVLKILIERNFGFFAPDPKVEGFVLPPSGYTRDVIVYLSPNLLERAQDHIEGTIAHELAHVYQGIDDAGPARIRNHRTAGKSMKRASKKSAYAEGLRQEKAADKLAERWGFRVPRSLTGMPETAA